MNFFLLRSTLGLAALAFLVPVHAARQCPMTTVTGPRTAPGDHFGQSLALVGDELIVSAPHEGLPGLGGNFGIVRVLQRDGAGWFLRQTLSGERHGHAFGESVACDGRTLAVLAPHYFGDAPGEPSQLYVYERGASGWQLAAEHLAEGPRKVPSFLLVRALAVAGDWIFVGGISSTTGAVHVFQRTAGTWAHVDVLRPAVPSPAFGVALATDGDTLAVGASLDGSAAPAGGVVHLFERSGGTWSPGAVLTPADPSAGQSFGQYVSLSGDRLVIGASGDDAVAADAGALYVFERGAGGWGESAKLAPLDLAPGARLGVSRIEGERVIGLAGSELLTFEVSGGAWSELPRVARQGSGQSLALSGDLAALGEPSADVAALAGGAVEVFAFDGRPCRTLATPRPVSWGKQRLELDRGPAHAGHAYWLSGSLRGTLRGIAYRGTRIPLDLDAYFLDLVRHPNSGLFTNNLGVLDSNGRASLVLDVPPAFAAQYSNLVVHHAFVEFGPAGFEHVSNAVTFRFGRVD
ncbi:MAG: hypothetical protein ABL998_06070 [Planctomycetota bacterium]